MFDCTAPELGKQHPRDMAVTTFWPLRTSGSSQHPKSLIINA
jgi:hypothetical protein